MMKRFLEPGRFVIHCESGVSAYEGGTGSWPTSPALYDARGKYPFDTAERKSNDGNAWGQR